MERGKSYPSKTWLNLAQKERKNRDLGAVAVTAAVLAIAVAVFCKFGVIDRLSAVSQAESLAEAQETQLAQLQESTAEYGTVLEEYQGYTAAQSVAGGADMLACLQLVEDELLGESRVESFSVTSDFISVQVSGVTLNDVSRIYQSLMKSTLVGGVEVYTASTKEETSAQITATMTIRLNTGTGTGSGKGAAS